MLDGLRDRDLEEEPSAMLNPVVWALALSLWIIVGTLFYVIVFGA